MLGLLQFIENGILWRKVTAECPYDFMVQSQLRAKANVSFSYILLGDVNRTGWLKMNVSLGLVFLMGLAVLLLSEITPFCDHKSMVPYFKTGIMFALLSNVS